MSGKHTPGKWFVVDNRDLDGGFWICVDHPVAGRVSLAAVGAGCEEAAALGDDEANANLMSAALPIYEALKGLAETLATAEAAGALLNHAPAAWANVSEWLALADAALAQAEGR